MVGIIDLPAIAAMPPMFGWLRRGSEDKMNYDWTGARTRRLALLRRTSYLVGAGLPLTLLLLHFVH